MQDKSGWHFHKIIEQESGDRFAGVLSVGDNDAETIPNSRHYLMMDFFSSTADFF